jgi:hypothetical protein
MFRNRPRRVPTALLAAACAVALSVLLASDASAHGRKWKGRGHGHRDRVVRVVERTCRPNVTWAVYRPAPSWCSDSRYVVWDGDPYWYHVGVGMYFGGVDVNVDIGNAPPRGYGYWDPYCDAWYDDARAYSTHCKRHDHRPALQVVRVDGCGHDRYDDCDCSCGHGDHDDHDDHDDHGRRR